MARSKTPEIQDTTKDFLKALASETRQQIMLLFVGDAELSVNDVASRTQLGQSTASEHLATLRRAGLLNARREGKTVYYRVNAKHIDAELNQLKTYLTACCP